MSSSKTRDLPIRARTFPAKVRKPESAEVKEAVESGPKKLTEQEVLVSLQRKFREIYPDKAIPEAVEELKTMIPSGLTEEEVYNYLRGSLELAKRIYLITLNQSYTKEHLRFNASKAGVSNALSVFDNKTRAGLENAIKFLPD